MIRHSKEKTAHRRPLPSRFLISAASGKSPFLLALAGIAAGFVNGLLGAGGGVIIARVIFSPFGCRKAAGRGFIFSA